MEISYFLYKTGCLIRGVASLDGGTSEQDLVNEPSILYFIIIFHVEYHNSFEFSVCITFVGTYNINNIIIVHQMAAPTSPTYPGKGISLPYNP